MPPKRKLDPEILKVNFILSIISLNLRNGKLRMSTGYGMKCNNSHQFY